MLVCSELDVGVADGDSEGPAGAADHFGVHVAGGFEVAERNTGVGERLDFEFVHGAGSAGHAVAPHGAGGAEFEAGDLLCGGGVGEEDVVDADAAAASIRERDIALDECGEGSVVEPAIEDGVERGGLEGAEVVAEDGGVGFVEGLLGCDSGGERGEHPALEREASRERAGGVVELALTEQVA